MENKDELEMISVAEFLSIIVYLAEISGNLIREVHRSADLGEKSKGKEGPVTVADLRV